MHEVDSHHSFKLANCHTVMLSLNHLSLCDIWLSGLCHPIFYHTMLFFTIAYYTILYLYNSIPDHSMLHCTMLYDVIYYKYMLYLTMPNYAVLY